MAITPKRINPQTQVADDVNTPMQQLSTNADMFGATQARQMAQAGADLSAVGDKFNEVRNKVRTREDVILRARAERKFYEESLGEFNRFKTEKDSMDPTSLKEFNTQLQSRMEGALAGFTGTADGRARLQARLEGMASQNRMAAQEHVDGVQRAEVLNQLGDRMQVITAKVIDDPSYLNQAFLDADALLQDLSPGLDDVEQLAQANAIRSQIVISSIDSLTNAGAYDEAEELIREHPAFIQQLSPELQRQTLGRIAEGQRRRQRAIEDVQNSIAAREIALKRKLTDAERTEIVLGRNPNAALTAEGKYIKDRQNIINEFGADSEQLREFEELHEMNRAKKGTPLEQAEAAHDRAVSTYGADSEEARRAKEQINEMDPTYLIRKDKIAKLPKARSALNAVIRQTELIQNTARNVIGKFLGTEFTSNEQAIRAIEQVLDGRREVAEGGDPIELLFANIGFETTEKQIENDLTTLRSNTIVSALTEMRQNSPTGGALGSVSDRENAMLAALKGVMDLSSPKATLTTLKNILENSSGVLEDRKAAYQADFGDLIKDQNGKTAASEQAKRGKTLEDGTPVYDVTLNGDNAQAEAAPGETEQQPAQAEAAPIPEGGWNRENLPGDVSEYDVNQLEALLADENITTQELIQAQTRMHVLGIR